MQPYHLAKLVEWAGRLETRKRLQKVVYLLQASGSAQLDASYILHHYGPYSSEVASVLDQLVRNGLLKETPSLNGIGMQYAYELTAEGTKALQASESGPQAATLSSFARVEVQAKYLLGRSMSELEFGSTMVFFHRQTRDWESAVQKTCDFKKLQKDGAACVAALALAKTLVH